MENKVYCVVSKATSPKCEGDSGESKSLVPLVTGHVGILYDAQKYLQQSYADFIHGPKILTHIDDQESTKNVTANVTVQKDSDQKSFDNSNFEFGGISGHLFLDHDFFGHIVSGHEPIKKLNGTFSPSSPNAHKGNRSHVDQGTARIGDQVCSPYKNMSLWRKLDSG